MKNFNRLARLDEYLKLPENEVVERILSKKAELGKRLIILGHHYQRPRIARLSDFVGDSFGLSEKAAKAGGDFIVFCGVRFMAESAAILCQPHQKVLHPDPDAGCPMADMANMDQVNAAWKALENWTGSKKIPVTYMNSTAELKAFCGQRDGIVCTSSNAAKAFDWAFSRGEKIFFFPDEHLGRNTAKKMGITGADVVVWDPAKTNGGLSQDEVKRARVILWAGFCPVHMEFKLKDIQHVRHFYPGCKVVVHPECEKEVVDAADASGSTEFIVKYVAELPDGETVFVGTEVNLITRLAQDNPRKKVFKLQRSLCLTMYQINLANLAYTLDHLDELEPVELSPSVKAGAKTALDRMLQLV
ncbi:MAG: quinolinate synthase NadA [Oligoflexia bacterium]|nr:quinolinate synthase NadA [Oligoflexia bacterium]